MTKGLHVPSEIGKLRKVCLHRPGDELLNLPPDELERLLFDDVPFLEVAQQEHDTFAQILRDQGVEVLYLENLVAEVFDQVPGARAEFTDQYIAEAGIRGQHMPQIVREKLDSIEDNLEFVKKTMAGMTKSEIDMPLTASTTLDSLVNSESESDLIIDPMPNLYFTRDPFAMHRQRRHPSTACTRSPATARPSTASTSSSTTPTTRARPAVLPPRLPRSTPRAATC